MATLPGKPRGDREFEKFCINSDGDVAVNVCVDGDINALPQGATGPIFVSGHTVTDSSAAFPATAQVGRTEISIRNNSPDDSIFIVNTASISKVTAGTATWEIGPNETENYSIDDTNSIFVVAESGKNVPIVTREIKGST